MKLEASSSLNAPKRTSACAHSVPLGDDRVSHFSRTNEVYRANCVNGVCSTGRAILAAEGEFLEGGGAGVVAPVMRQKGSERRVRKERTQASLPRKMVEPGRF
jgi:hypothetical protein